MAGFKNHSLTPHLGRKRSLLFKEEDFLLFVGVFFQIPHNVEDQEKNKMKTKVEGSGKSLYIELSSKCKEFVVALITRLYERESTMFLELCYVQYAEEDIIKFKTDMTQKVMDALHNNKWMEETQKNRYQKFLDNCSTQ